jgi:hypothetical protein
MKRKFLVAIVVATLAWKPLPATAAGVCGPILPGWQSARDDLSRPVNVLFLYDKPPAAYPTVRIINGKPTEPQPATPEPPKPPSWNGSPVTPEQVREYVSVTTQMTPPGPVFLLTVSPNADCTEVEQYRHMVKEILGCSAGECVEVDL